MVIYLDDILIFTRTVEKHTRAVQRVKKVLARYKLFLCLEKCKFQKGNIKYLGLVILENKVSIDPIKIIEVYEWPIPENWTNIQTFLGFINFYRRFVQDFSAVVCPLFDLI